MKALLIVLLETTVLVSAVLVVAVGMVAIAAPFVAMAQNRHPPHQHRG